MEEKNKDYCFTKEKGNSEKQNEKEVKKRNGMIALRLQTRADFVRVSERVNSVKLNAKK